MELAFVIDSVRRYAWVVILGSLLGAAAAVLAQGSNPSLYQSTAQLLIVPTSDAALIAPDSERYVFNQIAVLENANLAERVADQVDDDSTAAGIAATVRFEHIPQTDLVNVIVETGDPQRSQDIANAYLDEYFASLRAQVVETQQPELDNINAQLTAVQARLDVVNAEIEARLAPYLNRLNATTSPFVPTPEQVAPGLASERLFLETQYTEILAAQADLTLNTTSQLASEIVQRGTLPEVPFSRSNNLLVVAGLIGGAFFGLLAAALLGRFSPRLLGIRHAEEVLGQPLIGTLPYESAMARNHRVALSDLPSSLITFVDLVCVRAEAGTRSGESLVVVVTGTERDSGATTLATAMANRFAAHGGEVLLVDADARDPELTRLFAAHWPGVPDLLALAPTASSKALRDQSNPEISDCFQRTSIPNLRILGLGAVTESLVLRRQNVPTLVDVAARSADIVVIDAGALMDSAASLQLTRLADAVVLAIPDRQRSSTLDVIARQLRARGGALLAVWTPLERGGGSLRGFFRRRSRRRRNQRPEPPTPTDAPLELVPEQELSRQRRAPATSQPPR